MSNTVRAKMKVQSVTRHESCEILKLVAVAKSKYGDEGADEDNTFARFSPQADFNLTIANPELRGRFNPGETYYIDITPAP